MGIWLEKTYESWKIRNNKNKQSFYGDCLLSGTYNWSIVRGIYSKTCFISFSKIKNGFVFMLNLTCIQQDKNNNAKGYSARVRFLSNCNTVKKLKVWIQAEGGKESLNRDIVYPNEDFVWIARPFFFFLNMCHWLKAR